MGLADTSVRGYAGYVPSRRSGIGLPGSSNTRRCSGSVLRVSRGAAHSMTHTKLLPVRQPGRPTRPSDNGRLSGTTQAPASDHAGGGPPPGARLGHVIRYIGRGGATTGKITPLRERDTSTIQALADAFLFSPRYANPNTRRGYADNAGHWRLATDSDSSPVARHAISALCAVSCHGGGVGAGRRSG